jgi:hypothetical protein
LAKKYPYELTLDEFEDFIGDTGAEFIHFDDEERGDGYEMVIIEDNQKRSKFRKAAKKCKGKTRSKFRSCMRTELKKKR